MPCSVNQKCSKYTAEKYKLFTGTHSQVSHLYTGLNDVVISISFCGWGQSSRKFSIYWKCTFCSPQKLVIKHTAIRLRRDESLHSLSQQIGILGHSLCTDLQHSPTQMGVALCKEGLCLNSWASYNQWWLLSKLAQGNQSWQPITVLLSFTKGPLKTERWNLIACYGPLLLICHALVLIHFP